MCKKLLSPFDEIRRALFIFFLLNSFFLYSQATILTNPTNSQINSALNGPGIVITGGTLSGAAAISTVRSNQVATFTNGVAGAGLGLTSGAYFSTGNAPFELTNRNTANQSSYNPAGATTLSDPNLSTIDATATRDLISYSFTITLGPTVSGLKIGYQFGSEEYPDYVGSSFDDAFGFFITGPGIAGTLNMATLPNGNATSINKVNSGVPGFSGFPPVAAYDGTQSALYTNNGHTTTISGGRYITNPQPQPGPFPVFVELNGLTKLITRNVTGLTPGATYTFKIVIADAGDSSLDSGVFVDLIEGITNADLGVTKATSSMSPQVGCGVTFTLTASNAGPSNSTNTKVTDLLPSGYTFVSATPSVGTYNSINGVWDVGLLNIGATPTLSIVATVKPSGVYLNTASIASADIIDINGTNNSSSVTPVPTAAVVATNTTSTAAICENSTKSLSATPAGGTWSVVSGGGTISGTTYTPADVSSDTSVTVRYTVAANGSCPATTSDVTFTVNVFSGTATNTTSTAAICENSTKSLSATPAGGTWSVVSGGGTISGTTYTPADVSSDTSVTVRYTVAANGSCAATTSDTTFTVNVFSGTATNTTSTTAICENSTKSLSATPAGGTWSVVSGGGTISGTTYTPADVSSDTSVTVRYTVAANGSCAATTSDTTFTVNVFSGTATNTTSTTAICENSTKSLSATPAGGTWSVVSGGGTISGTTYTPADVSSDTSVTVRYTVAANGSCAATTSDTTFTVNVFSGTATNTTSTTAICENSTKSLSATPAGGTWSVVSGGGTISGTTYTPADVSSDTSVTVRYTVAANGSCAATTSDTTFTVNVFSGTATNTTSTTAICENSTKSLSATPAGGTWSVVSGGGTISGTTYTPADVSSDTSVTVRYTVAANGSCAATTSDTTFTVNVFSGTATNTTSTAAICENSTKSLSATPAGGTWSVVSGGGTISGTTYTPADVSSDTSVTVRYTVAANGSCAATTSDTTFTVNVFSGTATNTTSTTAICENSTKSLSATPAGGTWSVVSGGGTISGTTYTPADVSSDTSVTVRYTVAANGSCAATTSDTTFTVNVFSGTATNTTSTTAICENSTKSLSATPAGGTWSVVSGGGTISGTTYTPADVSSDTSVTVRYTVAANGSCAATTSDTTFTVNVFSGTATNTTSTTAICENSTKSLSATPAGGTWSVVSGGGTISGTTYTPADVSSDTSVTVRYTVAANGSCAATTSDTTFTVNVFSGTATNTTSTTAICENSTKSLSATPAGGTWSVVSGGGTISGTTYTPADVSSDTSVTVRYTVAANGSCAATTSDATFTVNVIPTTPTLGTIMQPTCVVVTGSVVLNDLPVGNWTINPGNINGSTSSTTISGLLAGSTFNYTVTVNGCSSGSIEVIINNYLCALTETTASINGNTGGNSTSLTSNDTLNGNPVVIGTNPGQVSLTSVTVPAGLTLNADGTVTVAPNTAAGNYTVEYKICEITNPSNCSTVSSTVVVSAAAIVALTETTASINGNTGGNSTSLTSNDTLNGNPVVIGTNPGQVSLTSVTVPAGLTLNADGTVTVAPNTAAGNYTVEYKICEITNPSNCSTVSSTVVVSAAAIVALTETTASINGNTGGNSTSLTSNDTLNGNPVVIGTNPGQVSLTSVTVPAGLTLNADGTVTVAPNTAAGNYTVEYKICEITNPSNCSTVSSTVVVSAAAIVALTETTASINGNTGGNSTSLTSNDTLNGNPVVIGTNPGQVSLTSVTVPAGLTLNADGTVTVAPNTAAGNYTVEYKICEITNPSNCSTVSSTVVVSAAAIVALTETTASINGNTGGNSTSLTSNDTLNGNPVVIGTNPGQVSLTSVTVPAGLTLNADGTVTVAPNTAAGNYTVEYKICEITNPSNCSTVSSTVVVSAAAIVALTETTASINGNTGGNSTSLTSNDTLNGNPVVIGTNPGQVSLTSVTVPAGLTLNADGTVTVAPNTAAGNYTVEYKICEITNPSNCSTVSSTVVVSAAAIVALTETTASINGNTGGNSTSLTSNDTLNGNPVVIGTNPGQVSLTSVTVPAGLTLNADGTVTVAPNTAAGNYTVEYKICEITNPSNCSTVSSTVVVSAAAIVALTETTASINGNTGGNSTSLTSNDTLNGNPVVIGTNPGQVSLTSVTVPAGLTLNADGTVTVAPNTAAGNYTVEYKICEITNPSNCSTVSSTVVVSAAAIVALTETTASINGNTGGNSTSLTSNDTLNGNPVVIGTNPGQVSLTSVTVPAGLTLNADGTVTVAPNTAAGNYTVEYKICEITNPSNCSTVSSTVVVSAAAIVALTETTASINGNTGGNSTSLTSNDTLNGNPVVIGTNPGQVSLTSVTVPAGLTLNADGTVTVAPNTAAGNYTVEYKICEITNPSNCSTVSSTVVVSAAAIVALTETTASINGNTGGNSTSLTSNDTLNGNPVVIGTNPGQVSLTSVTVPAGLTLNADGTVTVAPNTAAGNYTVEYKICEITNPSNCSTVSSTVVVSAAAIVALTETTASINGNTGGNSTSLTSNDTLNGNPVVIGTNPGQVSLTSVTVPAGLTLNADGTVTVAPNTAAGNYTVEYKICEITNPSNCSTVSSTVVVSAAAIVALTETTASINGNTGGNSTSLTSNDTLNGNPVVIGTNPGQVSLTSVTVPAGLTLNADGTVTVAPNTAAGNYTVEYKICEITNPSNCSTVSSTVVVSAAAIVALTETTASINGNTGGNSTSLTSNDTLNGNPVVIGTNPGQVSLTSVTVPAGLTLNADGTVTVAPNTAAGNYTVEYKICEITNPSNCSTVSSTVVVSAAAIVALTETTASINGNTGGNSTSLTSNDTLNGNPVVIGTNPGQVSLTSVTVPAGLTLNADGTVTVAPNTAAGNYTVEYKICEITNPSNCSTVSSTVVVSAAAIVALTETTASINGNTGGNSTSLTSNDTLNGNPVVIGTNPGQVSLTSVTVPAGLTLNADGTVTVAPNTAAGNYTVEYKICEITNPSNCSTVSSTVVVSAAAIVALTETTASINGNTGGNSTSLTSNDTLNGNPVVIGTNPGQVSLTSVTVPAGLTLNADGTVTVAPNTAAGNYTVEYKICEITNPSNCSTVSSTVVVSAAAIVALTETTASINGNTGGNSTSLTSNDTLNGNPVVIGTNPGQVSLTSVTVPAGLTLNADGTVTVAPNTAAGNYTVEYKICEITNPSNCSTVSSTVVVSAAAIVALTETTASINGNTGGNSTSLTSNDTLNGNPVVIGTNPGQVSLTSVTVPAGLTLNADGTVTVAPNTAAGNYTVEYKICEITNPSNCSTVSSTVVVSAAAIVALTETTASINGNTGGNSTSLTSNDTLNGNPVVIGTNPGQVSLTSVTVPAGLTLNADGTVTVAPNTAAGNYTVEYKICEITNPSNCSTVSSTVVVSAAAIVALTETTASINGNTGGNSTSLTSNDTLNGNPVVIGTNPGQVSLTSVTVPAGLTLNADGTVTVAPNTAAGNYTVEYKICEITNPSNCSTVSSTVVVSAAAIVALTETTASINGNTGGNSTSLTSNDTLNGNPVVIGTNPGQVSLTSVTVPAGLTLNADGTVTVAPNTAAGNYTVEYKICEITNPSNCSTVSSTVVVSAAAIVALTETTASINGNTGGNSTSLTSNDTLNGNPVVIGTNPGQVSLTSVTVPAGLTLNADGTVTVAPNTAAGNYTVEYKICEITNPSNCSTVSSTVVVSAAAIVALTETTASINGNTGGNSTSLTSNDTLNGNPVVIGTNPGQVSLTSVTVPAGLTLNADGTVTVAPNTAAGNYTVEYKICEITNPSNCSTVSSTVVVSAAAIVALTETTASINGNTGGNSTSLTSNDTLNGNPVVIGTNPGQVSLTSVTVPAGLTLNADGTVTVAPNTAAGNYTVEYKICEITNPSNCSTVSSTVVVSVMIPVSKPSIALVKTAHFNDENGDSNAKVGETITYNFTVTNTGNVALTNVYIVDPLTGITMTGGPINLGVGEEDNTSFTGTYSILQADINAGSISNQAEVFGTSPDHIVVKDKSDDSSVEGDKPTVLSLQGCVIKVFNAVSINGDSKNERFYIQGLECYPDNTVQIFNRWGVLVFDRDHYNNNDIVFRGISEGRVTIKDSDGLPEGTYYYIIKYKDNQSNPHQEAGYLYLTK
ncbi:choice-of-anchor L domain-containing protein [Flavobacterium sp. N502540]|uniref:choice-of-anchor L domain-containing protein n=1 Tax=Flavobacterium sp. N502540 TaxID=2986838 RepID=UPI00222474C0|nr:choice-of-anchor L domain-containing protein [Flavobacterium sp. N502540]